MQRYGDKAYGNTERLRYVDMTKGLCLLSIFAGHTGCFGFEPVASIADVPAFFFLAGYTQGYFPGFARFAKGKALKLLIPYFLLVVLMLPLVYKFYGGITGWNILGIFYGTHTLFTYPFATTIAGQELVEALYPKLAGFIGHSYIMPDNIVLLDILESPLWFLPAMFMAFMLFYWIRRLPGFGTGWLAVVACVLLSQYLQTLPVLLPWSLTGVPLFAAMMYAGMWVRRRADFLIVTWRGVCICLTVAVLCLWWSAGCCTDWHWEVPHVNYSVGEFGGELGGEFGNAGVSFLTAMAMTLSVAGAMQKLERWRPMGFLVWMNRGALVAFAVQMPFVHYGLRLMEIFDGMQIGGLAASAAMPWLTYPATVCIVVTCIIAIGTHYTAALYLCAARKIESLRRK